jgi:hypothetical protein
MDFHLLRQKISTKNLIGVKKIKEENDINFFFDVLLIDGSESKHPLVVNGAVNKELCKTRFVLLHDINNIHNHENYDRLLKSCDYLPVDENPGLRNGYAIFEKRTSADVQVGKAFFSAWRRPASHGPTLADPFCGIHHYECAKTSNAARLWQLLSH